MVLRPHPSEGEKGQPHIDTSTQRNDLFVSAVDLSQTAQDMNTTPHLHRHLLLCPCSIRALLCLAVLGVPLAWFVGIYNDYYRKVHTSESVNFGELLADLGSRQYEKTKQVPASISDLGAELVLPFGVRSVDVDPVTRIILIRVLDHPEGKGKLEFVPTIEVSGNLTYRCRPDQELMAVITMECKKRPSDPHF